MAIIWTKHAIERNRERQVTISWVDQTINSPDKSSSEEDGKVRYTKNFGKQTVSVVTAKGSNGEYLVISAWIDPPNPGTADYKREEYGKQMKKAGNFRKFLLAFLRQIGI